MCTNSTHSTCFRTRHEAGATIGLTEGCASADLVSVLGAAATYLEAPPPPPPPRELAAARPTHFPGPAQHQRLPEVSLSRAVKPHLLH